jgi:RimJ/RimL family protein N-acetyltransferase
VYPVTLTSTGLALREIAETDLPLVLGLYNGPRTRPTSPRATITEYRARQKVSEAMTAARRTPRTTYTLAVDLPDTGAAIGLAILRTSDPAPTGPVAQYGVAITPDHWFHGHASQARNLFQDLAVHTLGARRVLGAGNTLILLGPLALPADRAITDPLFHDGTRCDAPVHPCPRAAR